MTIYGPVPVAVPGPSPLGAERHGPAQGCRPSEAKVNGDTDAPRQVMSLDSPAVWDR